MAPEDQITILKYPDYSSPIHINKAKEIQIIEDKMKTP